jgi:phosphoesterase RecJ-like protein
MEAGASVSEISRRALDQLNANTVRLWGDSIERMVLDHGLLYTEVTREMRQHRSLGEDGATGLINFLSSVREADVVVVFNERDGDSVDVGLRSIPGCDVSQVALRLGGGGHPQASGCTLDGSLEKVRAHVLEELRRSLVEQRADNGTSSPRM